MAEPIYQPMMGLALEGDDGDDLESVAAQHLQESHIREMRLIIYMSRFMVSIVLPLSLTALLFASNYSHCSAQSSGRQLGCMLNPVSLWSYVPLHTLSGDTICPPATVACGDKCLPGEAGAHCCLQGPSNDLGILCGANWVCCSGLCFVNGTGCSATCPQGTVKCGTSCLAASNSDTCCTSSSGAGMLCGPNSQCCNGICMAESTGCGSVGLEMGQRKKGEYVPMDVRGKSVYFVVVDSFGGPPKGQSSDAKCAGNGGTGWCNGTIKGITDNLDYIRGMGFECVWITPVLKQLHGPDPDGRSGYGSYGYWAYNWYEIDSSYGTEADLVELSDELHKRGMCFIYDIVLNHVGPVHSMADVESIVPFNKPQYFHTYKIHNLTFDQYVQGFAFNGTGCPPPVQAIGPGAMCPSEGCDTYRCPVDPGLGNPCPETPKYIDGAPGPDTILFCGVGDMACEDYNEYTTTVGWFYDLGDLNQSVPFVRDELVKWGKHMKHTYNVDAFRLDTAPYVNRDFLSHFQREVKIPILGEVTAGNWSFFKSYAPKDGSVLKGLLNFFLQNIATPCFCGNFYPYATLNLSSLASHVNVEIDSGNGVYDLNLLGNFVDNHDMNRLASFCQNDTRRMNNAIAWTIMAKGMPIIYFGTEIYLKEIHPPFWPYGFKTDTPGYQLIKSLLAVRKEHNISLQPMEIKFSSMTELVFTRGFGVWVFLNNRPAQTTVLAGEATACSVMYPGPSTGKWVEALNNNAPAAVRGGRYTANSCEPQVLVRVRTESTTL